jgi:hypothetical protein
MGVATASWDTNKRLGDDSFSWTLRLNGKHANCNHTGLRHDGKSLLYHDVFPQGTRIGVLLDMNKGTLEYVIDGVKKGKKRTLRILIYQFIPNRCSLQQLKGSCRYSCL